MRTATFTFHGVLNDFLKPSKRGKHVAYTFDGSPAVKDAIEAIGVPHPEVAAILHNKVPVFFSHPLQPNGHVHVFPAGPELDLPEGYTLAAMPSRPYRFVLDVHLGTLASTLRMLGFDTLYDTNYSDKEIAHIAQQEQRIVLTRDIVLLKQKVIVHGYWLRSQHKTEQAKEVIRRFNLHQEISPFKLCLRCNGAVRPIPKEQVLDELPTKTQLYFQEFYQCTVCHKVYWKGSHYEHMQAFIEELKQES
ncbi:Mut7-C RNAse domain-containing protein [uncultured Pontibacter sp.]|uniref:Mut7-C RNAse domain-containing protein n=1 Tax=uncultured Pontibacter sp. TaxID=453356 RepID=UPI00263710B9|nr:Mut7-C RNAse domain-containing protein [uncultured Pontibacter sp.]